MNLAALIDAIPTVATTAERDARFSALGGEQKVYNKETRAIEVLQAGTWISLFIAAAALGLFNPKDATYGAKFDGVTNDRPAIQAAALAAGAVGGVLFLPYGVAIVGTQVYIPAGVIVRGQGRGATTVRRASGSITNGDANNTGAVFMAGPTDGTLYTAGAHGSGMTYMDLTVDGNGAGNPGVTNVNVGCHGIRTHFVDDLRVLSVEVKNCLETGTYTWGCRRSVHFATSTHNNGQIGVASARNGFSVTGPQDDATDRDAQDGHEFIGCYSYSNTDEGLAVGRNGRIVVTGGAYYSNGDMGIEGDSGTATADTTSVPAGWTITGVHVYSNGTHGIGLSNANVQRVAITGCVVEDNPKCGITTSFTSGSICVITGNTIRNWGTLANTDHGISVGTFDRVTLTGNTLDGGAGTLSTGIVLLAQAATRTVTIVGNHILGAGGGGLSITGKATGLVKGNVVYGTVSAFTNGILVSGGANGILNLDIDENFVMNSHAEGIKVRTNAAGNVQGVRLRGNTCTDDQGGKTQTYGLGFAEAGGGTVTGLVIADNDVEGNLNGRILGLTNAMIGSLSVPRRTQTIAFAAGITPDALAGEDVEVGALTGNITAVNAPTNAFKGLRLRFRFLQDGTGGRTVAGWNAVFKQAWADAGNVLNKQSMIAFRYDGTNWVQEGAQGPYV